MTRIHDRINRRTALLQLTAATMLAAGPAKAQPPDPSLAQIKTTDPRPQDLHARRPRR
jgi:hypothetical protein